MIVSNIKFPEFTGIRCLMMPYIQGDEMSVPEEYRKGYEKILREQYISLGEIGFLTIDESTALAGTPHRGDRAKYGRALHTEAGLAPNQIYAWGRAHNVELERDVKILLANNLDNSCAVWSGEHENTSNDGDIGDFSEDYPYSDAVMMKAGEVHKIGILTPHESLPVQMNVDRQFLRIMSAGVHGREPYFTDNPLMN